MPLHSFTFNVPEIHGEVSTTSLQNLKDLFQEQELNKPVVDINIGVKSTCDSMVKDFTGVAVNKEHAEELPKPGSRRTMKEHEINNKELIVSLVTDLKQLLQQGLQNQDDAVVKNKLFHTFPTVESCKVEEIQLIKVLSIVDGDNLDTNSRPLTS